MLTLVGAPERHKGTSDTLSAQTIDTWSLGCVFSMAATWVVLGKDGIKQYNQLRKKAIRKIVEKQSKQIGLEDSAKLTLGDYFHNRVKVLDDVLHWHDLLRNAVRRSDNITSRVIDLVDNKMLLAEAEERVTAKVLCTELESILEATQQEAGMQLPDSVMQILLEVDREAQPNVKSLPSNPSTGTTRTPSMVQLLAAPLTKTPFRSGYLSAEIAGRGGASNGPQTVQETHVNGVTDAVDLQAEKEPKFSASQQVQPHSAASGRIEEDLYNLPRRPTFAHKPKITASKNVWQAREAIEGNQNFLGRKRKDELLSHHFDNRDIVTKPPTPSSTNGALADSYYVDIPC
jgi:hypothetical protein